MYVPVNHIHSFELCASREGIQMKDKHLDINYAKVESCVRDKRPPTEIRHKLDIGFSYDKNTFEIFEVRPVYSSPDPNDYMKSSFAKFRYIKTQKIWKLY